MTDYFALLGQPRAPWLDPAGLKEAAVQPAAAFYHRDLGEFLLPYEAVRTAANPDDALRAFVNSTYDQAATLARWDRAALDRTIPERPRP